MVMVSLSETYDLHTVKDKMTLIGVHTPTKELIQKTYPGLCMNAKYCRIVKTDVVISSINSTVAVTPDMLGSTTDDIAPEDVLNPILYKAVSNDSWSTLEARLQGILQQNATVGAPTPTLAGSQAFSENDFVTGLTDEFGVYYSLLSNRDGFKIAPIQQGLEMRGLVPLVFEKYYTHGENYQNTGDTAPGIMESIVGGESALNLSALPIRGMRGRAHPMPRFNTTYLTGLGTSGSDTAGTNTQYSGMGDGFPHNTQIQMPDVPPVMLAAIVMPPSRRTTLWFRMVCRTWISFEEVRPIQEITSFTQMSSVYAPLVYHSDYNEQSKAMDHTTDMVDTKNAEIQKIMEGA